MTDDKTKYEMLKVLLKSARNAFRTPSRDFDVKAILESARKMGDSNMRDELVRQCEGLLGLTKSK